MNKGRIDIKNLRLEMRLSYVSWNRIFGNENPVHCHFNP